MTTQPASGPRTAIVTGGSRGIGRQCAERLAADGLSVVVNYAGNEAEANAAVAAAAAAGAKAIAVRGDVADEMAMATMFDEAEDAFDGIDVVVHAAGRMILGPLVDYDLSVLDSLHRTNIRGTFVIDQLAARRLRPGGSIVNFSTSVVGTSFPTYAAYATSKALSLILARELRGRDITVNAGAPGAHGDGPVPGRQRRGNHLPAGQRRPAGAARHPGRHRRGRRVPDQPGRPLDQWPDDPG
jgi:3-oxoacyl-[acyl-carrier protein] reductase